MGIVRVFRMPAVVVFPRKMKMITPAAVPDQ